MSTASAVRKSLRVPFLIGVALLAATSYSWADKRPVSLWDVVFGRGAAPHIERVVVVRVNPWIARVLDPSPHLFELGQARGDSTASMTDNAGIAMLEDALRSTGVVSEGCYGAAYAAEYLPVSWAIFFYPDREEKSKIGSVYVTRDGLCVSTGTKLYNVDPGINLYLERNFSFMNF